MQVFKASSFEAATQLKGVVASVEAEYGSHVVEGSIYTLAHHAEAWRDELPPCNREDIAPLKTGNILISHIDLDTIGGVAQIMGIKPFVTSRFWELVGYVDTHGQYAAQKEMEKYDSVTVGSLYAYHAWNHKRKKERFKHQDIENVTAQILEHITFLEGITAKDRKAGMKWRESVLKKVEKKLVCENEHYRYFSTDAVFCHTNYYSPTLGEVPTIISFNTKNGSLTISQYGKHMGDLAILMKSVYGKEAGGHFGIAGSPRGKYLQIQDILRLIKKIDPINNPEQIATLLFGKGKTI